MKKITRIVVFYEDGTFSESTPSKLDQPIVPTPYPPMKPIGPSEWPLPAAPFWYGNCHRCGLKLEGSMGYVCSYPDCPTGLGGAKCSTQSNT
jgi:hypothetical protein